MKKFITIFILSMLSTMPKVHLYAQEINKSEYIIFGADNTLDVLNVISKKGIGKLSLGKVKEVFKQAFSNNKYSVTEFNTYFSIGKYDTETLAGVINIYDYKQKPSNQMHYSFSSRSTSHNYNINKSDVIKKMKTLGFGNPNITTGSSASLWTWEWKSNGFDCSFGYNFNTQENWESINYTCNNNY